VRGKEERDVERKRTERISQTRSEHLEFGKKRELKLEESLSCTMYNEEIRGYEHGKIRLIK